MSQYIKWFSRIVAISHSCCTEINEPPLEFWFFKNFLSEWKTKFMICSSVWRNERKTKAIWCDVYVWYGFDLLQNNKYYNLIWKIYILCMCVCVALQRTAKQCWNHRYLSANNWLHIKELLELREHIIIIWHTTTAAQHIITEWFMKVFSTTINITPI